MPLYEYQCDACQHRFEVIQKYSDAPIDVCPLCGAAVRKLISSPAIQFKGSGWYITDYAKKSSTDASNASKAKEMANEKKPDTASKSESSASDKPAATPAKSDAS